MDKALTSKLEERASLARSFKIITLFLIITTIFLIPKSYATTWDLTNEQSVFKDCIVSHNLSSYNYAQSYPNTNFSNISDNLINQIFSYVKSGYENNDINQDNYPTLLVTWWYRIQDNKYRCTFYFLSTYDTFYGFTTSSQSLRNDCPMVAVVVDDLGGNPYILQSSFQAQSGGNNMIFFDGQNLNFFMLTDNGNSNTLPQTNYPYYVDGFKKENIFSNEQTIGIFNPSTLQNDFILNKEFKIGYNYTYNYDYYYYSNNEKVSIKQYVTFSIDTFWNEQNFSPYIDDENFQYIPTDTDFYFDLKVTGKGNLSNYEEIIDNEVLVFRTTSQGTPIPSGDSSGDNSGSGNIDYTNQLNNINNNITNSTNTIVETISGETTKIINKLTSGEEAIVGAIAEQNENYWGSSGELTGEQQSGEAQEMITSIIETASGELASGEISATLNTLEKGITDMFVYGRENPEMLDFIVKWKNVEFENKILIPSGEINFSKICRDNETLGTVKAYIQTICVFWAGWGLICQIWNLLLATLGIDNPYLYKEYQPDDTVSTVIDTTTGEIKGQYYTRRRRVR